MPSFRLLSHLRKPPTMSLLARAALCASLLPLTACETYEARPIEAERWLAELRQPVPVPEAGVSLKFAVRRMLGHNPAVLEARQTARALSAQARLGTPLANPEVWVAPVYLAGGGVSGSMRHGLEAGLGWALPIWGTRSLRDAVLHSDAGVAGLQAVLVLRREYLQLRAELLRHSQQQRIAALLREDETLLQRMVKNQEQLGANAGMNSLEQGLLRLDLLELAAEAGAAEIRDEALLGDLALRCGISLEEAAALPAQEVDLLAEVPALEALRDGLLEHAELLVLRARHQRADDQLRLELRRQYPGIELGTGYEDEAGGHKYTLPLGVQLPLFDRNQQGIAAARAERDGLAARYRVALQQLLTAQDSAHRKLVRHRARYGALHEASEVLCARLRRMLETQQQAGQINLHLRLEVLRRLQQAEIKRLQAAQDLLDAWLALEAACAAPLLELPGAPTELGFDPEGDR